MALTRFTLLAFCGVAFVALLALPVSAKPTYDVGTEEPALPTQVPDTTVEQPAVGGDINAPGQKILQPTDPAADPAATDAAATEAAAADPAAANLAPAADPADPAPADLKPIIQTMSEKPDYATLVAAVSVAVDAEGKKLADDIAAEGPFTASQGYFTFHPTEEKGSSPSLYFENWGRERPTAVFFWSADWRSGDSRVIGGRFTAPMKNIAGAGGPFFR
jgi:hypothetical protein